MDPRALKEFVNTHPDGVVIRMIDGTEYEIPHRDFIWFTPGFLQPESRVGRLSTCFYVSHEGVGRLVNALLVAEVVPMKGRNGKGRGKRRGAA
jgi:hypothetical protein